MGKNTYFTGQPILNQILKLIPKDYVLQISKELGSNRYYKSFDTYNHLVTMLYCTFNKCTSSREVSTGMKACENKLHHLGIKKSPPKSTLCDANKKRSFEAFEMIYKRLHDLYRKSLPDSPNTSLKKDLYILDSSTISLFQEILKAAGKNPVNGKRKGGIKVHTLIDASEDIPLKIKFTSAAAHDVPFLKEINLNRGAVVAFDKGYVDYKEYQRFSDEGMFYVTRLREKAIYEVLESLEVADSERENGVIKDQIVIIGHTTHKQVTRTKARLVTYSDNDKTFCFLTNNFDFNPLTVANIYKDRWKIELLFKRIKQNFPLKYFLGDNENAIKIQIWCAFIADLLLKVIQAKTVKKWAYSNLVSIVRLHLLSYIDLLKFLNDPDKLNHQKIDKKTSSQLTFYEIWGYG